MPGTPPNPLDYEPRHRDIGTANYVGMRAAQMSVNLRGRVEGCADLLAGNYDADLFY